MYSINICFLFSILCNVWYEEIQVIVVVKLLTNLFIFWLITIFAFVCIILLKFGLVMSNACNCDSVCCQPVTAICNVLMFIKHSQISWFFEYPAFYFSPLYFATQRDRNALSLFPVFTYVWTFRLFTFLHYILQHNKIEMLFLFPVFTLICVNLISVSINQNSLLCYV